MKKNPEPSASIPLRSPDKVTFIGLLGLTVVLLLLGLSAFYIIPYWGLTRLNSHLPWIIGLIMVVGGALIVLSLLLLIAASMLGHDVVLSRRIRGPAAKFLLPVLVLVGKIVGLTREQVQHAFVAVNNELVMAQCRNGHPPRSILLLMPHCLQDKDCTVKITHNVENCKRCGKCRIKDLLEVTGKYGVDLAVATGGTIARRIVKEKRPDLIIAVACERDLTSGIQDTIPLPVYGIFNERPFGPCLNTQVAMDRVEEVLREIASLQRKKA
ncbi:MAG: DUF116 domain-containing protein [Syntrophobacteraceae bacterium]